jgi:hypothetical protein
MPGFTAVWRPGREFAVGYLRIWTSLEQFCSPVQVWTNYAGPLAVPLPAPFGRVVDLKYDDVFVLVQNVSEVLDDQQ